MGRRRYTADFKRRVVVEAMRGDQTVQAIAAATSSIASMRDLRDSSRCSRFRS